MGVPQVMQPDHRQGVVSERFTAPLDVAGDSRQAISDNVSLTAIALVGATSRSGADDSTAQRSARARPTGHEHSPPPAAAETQLPPPKASTAARAGSDRSNGLSSSGSATTACLCGWWFWSRGVSGLLGFWVGGSEGVAGRYGTVGTGYGKRSRRGRRFILD